MIPAVSWASWYPAMYWLQPADPVTWPAWNVAVISTPRVTGSSRPLASAQKMAIHGVPCRVVWAAAGAGPPRSAPATSASPPATTGAVARRLKPEPIRSLRSREGPGVEGVGEFEGIGGIGGVGSVGSICGNPSCTVLLLLGIETLLGRQTFRGRMYPRAGSPSIRSSPDHPDHSRPGHRRHPGRQLGRPLRSTSMRGDRPGRLTGRPLRKTLVRGPPPAEVPATKRAPRAARLPAVPAQERSCSRVGSRVPATPAETDHGDGALQRALVLREDGEAGRVAVEDGLPLRAVHLGGVHRDGLGAHLSCPSRS